MQSALMRALPVQANTARLIISDSEHHADMLYVSGLFVPDAFIAIEIDGVWHGLLSALEVDRARKQSRFAHIHLDTPWREKAKAASWEPGLASIAAAFLSEHAIGHCIVPDDFPLQYAEQLRQYGMQISCATEAFFPQRIIKRADEITQIARAERLTKRSMQQAKNFIANCGIGNDGILRHPDDPQQKIKAQHIRQVIDTWLMQHGAIPSHTIVACGKQGSDPHNTGSGYIRSAQPIIIDIFPRLMDTGYWGDMTRTFVKGKASPEIKRMYRAVKSAQQIGLDMVANDVLAANIHQSIQKHFEHQGFHTGMQRGKQCGFFHGTGHGVGLDIHEAPRVSTADNKLQTGQVITIEPGLYYPHLGGIRLEDLVAVQAQGCRNLTRYPCQLEIP